MSTNIEVRRLKWAGFVRRAIETAKLQRGWTVAQVLKETSIGRTTLYRWLGSDWTENPEPATVQKFCDGIGADYAAASAILWPAKGQRLPEPEPQLDPDMVAILRKLTDPNTSEADKTYIRRFLRTLATMPASDDTPVPRKRRS